MPLPAIALADTAVVRWMAEIDRMPDYTVDLFPTRPAEYELPAGGSMTVTLLGADRDDAGNPGVRYRHWITLADGEEGTDWDGDELFISVEDFTRIEVY